MMVCVTVPLVLLQASTACQVLVSEYVFPQPAAVVSLSSTIEEVLHVSEVVGEVNVGEAGHSTVPSLPWPPIVGAWSSTTMMVCGTVPLVLLQASRAGERRVGEEGSPRSAAVH